MAIDIILLLLLLNDQFHKNIQMVIDFPCMQSNGFLRKTEKSVLETRPEIAVVRENPVPVELGGQLPVDWPLLMSLTWP